MDFLERFIEAVGMALVVGAAIIIVVLVGTFAILVVAMLIWSYQWQTVWLLGLAMISMGCYLCYKDAYNGSGWFSQLGFLLGSVSLVLLLAGGVGHFFLGLF
ncbi:hypothetical protein HYW46_04520 [Candidatus Daviesbacteria bacterium]|nr:hypothetical protein [Candidatus Daviesbacteria bacterium]